MGEVINLNDYRETCVAIEGTDNEMHIVYLHQLQKLIDGEITADQIDNFGLILPAILDNWLYLMEVLEYE